MDQIEEGAHLLEYNLLSTCTCSINRAMELSQTAIISAACIGTAVIAGAYVLWGPDNLFRKRGKYIITELVVKVKLSMQIRNIQSWLVVESLSF